MDWQAGMSICIQYASFLIRLWRSVDPDGGSDLEWHSEVEHIQSGEVWSFSTLDALRDFISQQATQPLGLEWIELKEE
jgi:hypothetical protein